MKACIALLVLSGVLAVAQASALKPRDLQGLQYSCDLKRIVTLYENIWAQTYFLRTDLYDTVTEAVNDVGNCKQVLPHVGKFVACVKETVTTGLNNVADDVQNYTNTTRALCDQLTAEIKNCVTF